MTPQRSISRQTTLSRPMVLPTSCQHTPQASFVFNELDPEVGAAQARDLQLLGQGSEPSTYMEELKPTLRMQTQWLVLMNIVACICCTSDSINSAVVQVTGNEGSPWTSIILELACDALWLLSGIFVIFDFNPEKYPFMGLGRRPEAELDAAAAAAVQGEEPSPEIVQDYQDYINDLETRLSRRFRQDFAMVERRLEDLELVLPRFTEAAELVPERPSSIPEDLAGTSEDLTVVLEPLPWKLEDHLASLGARLREIESVLSEAGDDSGDQELPSSPSSPGRGQLMEDEFDAVDDLEPMSHLSPYHDGGLDHQEFSELEAEALQRLGEAEERQRLEELTRSLRELEGTSETGSTDAVPSGDSAFSTDSVQTEDDGLDDYSATSQPGALGRRDSGSAAQLSLLPLSGRLTELETLLAKIVSQLCASPALGDELREQLRFTTHQALRKRLPSPRRVHPHLLAGPRPPALVLAHRLHSRRLPKGLVKAPPSRLVPGKTVPGRTSRIGTAAAALRYRRALLAAGPGRQSGAPRFGSGGARLGGTPSQPSGSSQGRL